MTKKNLAKIMEWLRPVGIGVIIFFAYYFGSDAISRFHILGPFVVMLMSGTVAFESLILGEVASEKIGYKPHREYQIQPLYSHSHIECLAWERQNSNP